MGAGTASCGEVEYPVPCDSSTDCAAITLPISTKLALLTAADLNAGQDDEAYRQQRAEDCVKAWRETTPMSKVMLEYVPGANAGSKDREVKAKELASNLMDAARAGDFKATVDAVAEGVSLETTTLRGHTPLMLAASSSSKGSVETVKFLVNAQADHSMRCAAGWTPLLYACRNGHSEAVDILVEKGASIKARTTDGKTAMMLAVLDGADDLAVNLINKMATQLEKKDSRGWTVLVYAIEAQRVNVVKYLLKNKAKCKDRTVDGSTAMMICAGRGDIRIGKLLASRNAELNSKDKVGNTALLRGLKADCREFCEWIIEQNADVTIKNLDRDDPMEIARAMGMKALMQIMERKARFMAEAAED